MDAGFERQDLASAFGARRSGGGQGGVLVFGKPLSACLGKGIREAEIVAGPEPTGCPQADNEAAATSERDLSGARPEVLRSIDSDQAPRCSGPRRPAPSKASRAPGPVGVGLHARGCTGS